MTETRHEGERWSGRIGFALATIGSAIGIGSIWKFPYEAGENGGGTFVLAYILGLLLVVLPLMVAEFVIGRRGRGDFAISASRLAEAAGASPLWRYLGWLGIATGFLVLTYYAVIAGQIIAYVVHALAGGFASDDATTTRATFDALMADPYRLAFYQALFLGVTAFIVARGIGAGVEVACKFLMPVLFLLIVLLVIYALAEGAAAEAVAFLFAPHWDQVSPGRVLEALGLGFFSIGVGFGLMVTYASYADETVRLGDIAVATVIGDTVISLLAGLAIFPLVFGAGLDPAAGASLMFLTLPLAFADLPFGDIVGAAFFVLLFIAALASAMSLLELVVLPLIRTRGGSRRKTATIVAMACWLGGLPTVLSFNLWKGARPLGFVPGLEEAGIFDLIDSLASNVMLPAAGLLLAIFAGWRLKRAVFDAELALSGAWMSVLLVLLRWVAPAIVLATVLGGLIWL